MKFSRRNLLTSTLFGAGYIGLRALATGLPAAALLGSNRAFASTPTCGDKTKAQFVIMMTSQYGDPINANAPGTYATSGPLSKIAHNPDPTMKAHALTIGGLATTAALPWSTLPQNVLDRTCFWHIATGVHPKHPDVLRLLGRTTPNEMLPSLLARQLAPCLGTVQAQPITLGAVSPTEGLSYSGMPLPIIPPLALKTTLTSPTGPLTNLQSLRDQTLANLDDVYRNSNADAAQIAYLDSLIKSQSEVRNIRQDLLGLLSSITDNSVDSQIAAALALIQMNVTPVVAIHIPFGGDNHNDNGLQNEATQTVSGVASIVSLMSQLKAAGIEDQVTLMSLNVFGRTIGPGNTGGRQHNENHQVSLTIGKPFKGGIIGGVGPVGSDYGALGIDSQTGKVGSDIKPADSLASFGKTALAAVGAESHAIEAAIPSGTIVQGALA